MNRFALYSLGLLLLIALVGSCAWADDSPFLAGPGVESTHLEAFARAEDRKTLAEYYDAKRPLKANGEKLTRLMERAQGLWLSGSTDGARGAFKEMAALALEDDWREPHREAIAFAMMRLAQSALTPTEKNEWIEKLAALDFESRAQKGTFPPPLVQASEEAKLRARNLSSEVSLKERFPDYRFVLVNGSRFDVSGKKKVRLPIGRFRMTALSDSRAPVTEKMSSVELSQYRVASPPLAMGTCAAPQVFDVPGIEGAISVLYPDQCIRTHSKNSWFNEVGAPIAGPSAGFQRAEELGWPMKNPADSPQPFLSNRSWWIIGATAVLIGTAYAVKRSSEKQIEPTTRQGF